MEEVFCKIHNSENQELLKVSQGIFESSNYCMIGHVQRVVKKNTDHDFRLKCFHSFLDYEI